jgi:hypothetical protein
MVSPKTVDERSLNVKRDPQPIDSLSGGVERRPGNTGEDYSMIGVFGIMMCVS